MADEDPRSEYERRYMSEGHSLFRSRQVMPWWWFALWGFFGLLSVVACVADNAPGGLLIALPSLTLITFLFSHLRVNLTDRDVHVQYGVFGPRIALDRIVSCGSGEYSMLRFGGFGIKRSLDGTWAFSVPGAGRCVEIAWRDDKGTLRKVAVTSPEADALAQAINQARAARAGTGVRAAVDAASAVTTAAPEEDAHHTTETQARKGGP
jgi:hypothetical protein